jgi:hypothetical protein
MPIVSIPPHIRWPERISPKMGYTGIVPSGTNVGQRCHRSLNHLRNWRSPPWAAGSYPPQAGLNDITGNYYVIVHHPPRTSAVTKRRLAISMSRWGTTAGGAWTVVGTEDVFGGAGAMGTLWSGTDPITTLGFTNGAIEERTVIADLEPPPGTGGSAFEVMRLTNTNQYLASLSCWWSPTLFLSTDQIEVTSPEVGPGRIIRTDTWGTVAEQLGDGSIDEDYAERMTRRTWINWAHSTGIHLPSNTAKTNLLGALTVPCQARNIDGTNNPITSYPAAVVTATRTGANPAKIWFDCTGDSWSYEVQAAEYGAGAFLVTYDRTGASDVTGCNVLSGSEDTCTISGETGVDTTLTVHSLLFTEGDGYSA